MTLGDSRFFQDFAVTSLHLKRTIADLEVSKSGHRDAIGVFIWSTGSYQDVIIGWESELIGRASENGSFTTE